ncbi:MAG TPA: hypothetical protein VF609_01590 [Flavisolibacter sp.]|jgi:putative transposase
MHFESNRVYHLYNRGNDKQKVFFNRENYLYFLRKVRKEWLPYADILAYCLMPNHFHFILVANEAGCHYIVLGAKETHLQILSKVIGKTLSSYTQAINKQQNHAGNLFQKKTKAKCICKNDPVSVQDPYLLACAHYIHLNPQAANLASIETDWEFSSSKDYAGIRNGTLCNKELLFEISGMKKEDFVYDEANEKEVTSRLF